MIYQSCYQQNPLSAKKRGSQICSWQPLSCLTLAFDWKAQVASTDCMVVHELLCQIPQLQICPNQVLRLAVSQVESIHYLSTWPTLPYTFNDKMASGVTQKKCKEVTQQLSNTVLLAVAKPARPAAPLPVEFGRHQVYDQILHLNKS